MKTTELQDKTVEELESLAAETAEQHRAIKTALRSSTYKRSHELGGLAKKRAQILTILANKRTITHS